MRLRRLFRMPGTSICLAAKARLCSGALHFAVPGTVKMAFGRESTLIPLSGILPPRQIDHGVR